MAAYGVLLSCSIVGCACVCVCSLIPGVHGPAERMPGFSLLRIREIFPRNLETVILYSSAYGIRITVLF